MESLNGTRCSQTMLKPNDQEDTESSHLSHKRGEVPSKNMKNQQEEHGDIFKIIKEKTAHQEFFIP